MYEFVVAVDRRSGRFGADLERYLRETYDYWNFIVEGISGTQELGSIRALAMQTDSLLEGAIVYQARYYIALTTASVVLPSPVGPVPTLVTTLTAIDPNGLVLFDQIEPLGHWVPLSQRNYSKYRNPDLLDLVGAVVNGLLHPELIAS